MADIVNGGGKKEKKHKSFKSKSNKDSAKENTVCVEIDTVHQKKRKKVCEVEVIHGNGKETNESSDVLQVDSKKRGKKRKNRSVSPEKNQGNHLVVDEPLAKSKAEKKKKAKKSCIEGKSDDLTQLIETNDYVKSKQKKHEEGSEVLHGDAIDKEPKSKDKKKKKNSSSEHLNTESIQNGEGIPCDAKKESVVHENKEALATHIENDMETKSKDKKKKKHKSTSEHLNTTEIIENDGSLSCDVKKENSNTNKSSPNEKNVMTPNEKNGMTPNEKNVTDSNCLSGSMTEKKQYSHETKSLPFQRVKIDEVKFADSRLKDNSYWAKGGADSGYGAKAQEVLGQVRGRDFRHEKTKKKRGSYRGGVIDLESHSIKFNYSDED